MGYRQLILDNPKADYIFYTLADIHNHLIKSGDKNSSNMVSSFMDRVTKYLIPPGDALDFDLSMEGRTPGFAFIYAKSACVKIKGNLPHKEEKIRILPLNELLSKLGTTADGLRPIMKGYYRGYYKPLQQQYST